MNTQNRDIEYCMAHTSLPPALLEALDRETNLKTLSPQMQSGPYLGTLLRMISEMLKPASILEIGAYTGYATLCLAAGLAPGGKIHTIEVNDELEWIIRKYVSLAGLQDRVKLHIGDAAELIPQLDMVFDLVFLDAGKLDYAAHYELVMPKIRSGGILLADNVLWDGKVAGADLKDETAIALRKFNDMVHSDPRVENLILPVRDGLMVIRKL